jgi:hypothetical protein
VNDAIETRDALHLAVAERRVTAARAARALNALDGAIADSVQLKDRSSEGSLIFGTRLRDYLAYLGSEVDSAYVAPTSAEEAIYAQLHREAADSELRLRSAVSQTHGLI